ncbi:hypothetical protein HAX54_028934, partial [Datura stramonium]|nr:hypothetical protein [Datura stramonium]
QEKSQNNSHHPVTSPLVFSLSAYFSGEHEAEPPVPVDDYPLPSQDSPLLPQQSHLRLSMVFDSLSILQWVHKNPFQI